MHNIPNGRVTDNHGEPLTIERFLTLHYFPQRDLRSTTRSLYLHKVKRFSVALGRPARLDDFTDATVNWYLSHRLETVKRETVRSDKASLISIWNAAYDERMVDEIPRRVKKIRREGRIVEGWNPQQLARLLTQCDHPPGGRAASGRFQGKRVGRALYWRAVVLFAYDTGLRLGDVLAIDFAQMSWPEPFTIVQRKTCKPVRVAISEATWRAAQELRTQSGAKLYRVLNVRYFHEAFKALAAAAGVPGTFSRFLRRTSGSMVEAMQPGAGSKHLGHADPTIFDRHYNVRSLTERPPMLPPAIPNCEVSAASINRTQSPIDTRQKAKWNTSYDGGTLSGFSARGFKAIKRLPTMFLWRPGEKVAQAIDGRKAWLKHRDETGPRWRTVVLTVEHREHFERIAAACYCGAPGVDRCDFCSGAREA